MTDKFKQLLRFLLTIVEWNSAALDRSSKLFAHCRLYETRVNLVYPDTITQLVHLVAKKFKYLSRTNFGPAVG